MLTSGMEKKAKLICWKNEVPKPSEHAFLSAISSKALL